MANLQIKKVSIIGLGYIGLPTAAILASKDIEVIGIDINEHVLSTINKGEIHIVEPGLGELVSKVVKNGKLRATSKPQPSDVFVITVPTPFKDGHVPDISFVEAATKSIAPCLQKGNLVVLESTSPVGTTEIIAELIYKLRPDLCGDSDALLNPGVHIAYCPERVLPGKVLEELVLNDRVIGGLSQACSQRALELYRIFVKGNCIISNARTAEMCKLTENAFRDVNIAFANELSLICDKLEINVWELIGLANRHPRVNILQPGPGVGGHCIAVDPWFIVNAAPNESKLIRAAREVNDFKPQYLIEKIEGLIKKGFSRIAFLGMSYKPNVDDFRESPSVGIIEAIACNGNATSIKVVEPYAQDLSMLNETVCNRVELCEIDEALNQSDVIILLVDHEEFKSIAVNQLADKTLIDSKGCWEKK
jgi:UDP-N-acetyl-D-mannosaminuronic acid dehydrogenase